ncbi:Disease resistance protein RUN1 [Linum grandiflorum]
MAADYDVFLSFRGADTRHNFTAHLYRALLQRGIKAYRDDNELTRGNTIDSSLLQAIESSRFSLVVFSRSYAESPWCLDELVKIVDCRRRLGQGLLPVFYDVDPSVVAERSGVYRDAFAEHELRYSPGHLQRWKEALEEAGNVSGWDAQNKDQSEIVGEIAETIWLELSKQSPAIMDGLVGMDSRLCKLKELMGEDDLDDVRFIGICGMGGIGKTTLARVVYNEMSRKFQSGRCFLENVRDSFVKHGAVILQQHLLSGVLMEKNLKICDAHTGMLMIKKSLQNKKVLLILDDVDSLEQLEMLAANHDWFGPGSRIIITSRDQRLLNRHEAFEVVKLEGLGYREALTLFSLNAFKQHEPMEEFKELCMRVLEYAQGLPLAIRVLGCFLGGRSKREWESAIASLKDYCNDILDVLKISFDALNKHDQDIFLDIACFFNWKSIREVKKVLDICGFCADIGVQHLVEKSLLTFSDTGNLGMHDLLRDMGREIVCRGSPRNPGRRSRLWDPEDVISVLMTPTGREEVEAIVLDLPEMEELQLNMEAFSNMFSLRLLIIRKAEFDAGPINLPSELRFLEWDGYPSDSFPASFRHSKLVELIMHCSNLSRLWQGKAKMSNLKAIDVSHSHNLITTPDLSRAPNVERLIFEDCISLCDVHPTIGSLKKLTFLSFSGCPKLKNLPGIVGKLLELHLDGTAIDDEELHRIVQWATYLTLLCLKGCESLKSLPRRIGSLKQLEKLNLCGCSQLDSLPDELGDLESLVELDLSGTSITQAPASVSNLKKLKVISFQGCKGPLLYESTQQRKFTSSSQHQLVRNCCDMPKLCSSSNGMKLPSLFGYQSITTLDLGDCGLREGDIPRDMGMLFPSLELLDLSNNDFVSLEIISQLSRLYSLRLDNCMMLTSLPELPSRIEFLYVNRCISLLEMPEMKRRGSIFYFEARDCSNLYDENGISPDTAWLNLLTRPLLKGEKDERLMFTVAGSRIPKWFSNQMEGDSICVSVPKSAADEIMGVALCAVYRNAEADHDHICFFYVPWNSILFLLKGSRENWRAFVVGLSFEKSPLSHLRVEVLSCGYRLLSLGEVEQLTDGDGDAPGIRRLVFDGSRSGTLVYLCANDYVFVRVIKVHKVC